MASASLRRVDLTQRLDLDALPAAFGPLGPVLAAMHLNGDAPRGTELRQDLFFVVGGSAFALHLGGSAVERANLQVVDPGRDLGILAFHANLGRVPVIELPSLDPV